MIVVESFCWEQQAWYVYHGEEMWKVRSVKDGSSSNFIKVSTKFKGVKYVSLCTFCDPKSGEKYIRMSQFFTIPPSAQKYLKRVFKWG